MRYWPALAALALIAAGCGKKQDEVATPSEPTTVQQKGFQTTVDYKNKGDSAKATADVKTGEVKVAFKGKKGDTASVDTKAEIGPKELGVELYPGATPLHDAGDSTKMQVGGATSLTVRLSTSDKPDAVTAFYKKHLKDADVIPMGEFEGVAGKNAAGDDVTVSADPTKKKGTTEITIMVTKKK
jgi:hypothetical protein